MKVTGSITAGWRRQTRSRKDCCNGFWGGNSSIPGQKNKTRERWLTRWRRSRILKRTSRKKFGIPRQSGLVEELRARIVFELEFRSPDAVRGLDGYDYIWLVWQFSTVVQAGQDGTNWRPTVRPPRLGGNTRMGVFATRSPFRPNALGLSSVKLLKVEPNTPQDRY